MEFAAGRVLENEREAEQLQRLKVHIGGAASAYTKAGQFIQASQRGWWRVQVPRVPHPCHCSGALQVSQALA